MDRVLYFTRDYTPHDWRFLSALATTDYQIYSLRLERRGYQLEDRPLPRKIEQVHWAGGQKAVSLRDFPRLFFDLQRVIREIKPDLIHAGPMQTAALLVALVGFHPLISMSWGYDLLKDADRNRLWRLATSYTLKHSTLMVGDCNTVRQKAIGLGMPDERIVTFPWGVDIQTYSPGYSDLKNGNTFTLLSTRNWEPIYGVDVLAKAFIKVAGGYPEIRLLLLGRGSLASQLRRIFVQAGVSDQVIAPGHVTQADLVRYYRAADIYVSASHTDGSSVSLMEAMACGIPGLVSDIPGNREWIEPGVQGWWFPDGDVDALSEAISTAIQERKRLSQMGNAARHVAEQRADWPKNFPELLRAYDLALRSSG